MITSFESKSGRRCAGWFTTCAAFCAVLLLSLGARAQTASCNLTSAGDGLPDAWGANLRLLYFGIEDASYDPSSIPTAPVAANCGSTARSQLVGDCGLYHAYRPTDDSAASVDFKQQLQVPASQPYCNAPSTPSPGGVPSDLRLSEKGDADPLRVPCSNGEDVCRCDGTLGVVLPIDVPPTSGLYPPDVIYPGLSCATAGLVFGPKNSNGVTVVSNPFLDGFCSDGSQKLVDGCVFARAGGPGDPANCAYFNTNQAGPTLAALLRSGALGNPACPDSSAQHDGRSFNLDVRAADGTLLAGDASADWQGHAWYRIHMVSGSSAAPGAAECQALDSASQIDCLVDRDLAHGLFSVGFGATDMGCVALADGSPCTDSGCDPVTGAINPPLDAGTSCGPSDPCNGSALCDGAGDCEVQIPELPPSTACTVYSCDPVAGIVGTPAGEGTPCELDACTPGTCSADGECLPTGVGMLEDDGNPCTVERCDPELGPIQVTCPPLDETVTTTVLDAYEWVYAGDPPIQTGVAPGTIELRRAALLRGTLRNRSGDPIPSVAVSVIGHPELGTTTTNADGSFLLVVNAGGELEIAFTKWGFLSSARRVRSVWNQTVTLDDVVLIPADPAVTSVDVSAASPNYQVAMGSVVTDDGASPPRQAAVLFPPNTAAMMHHANGSTEMLDSASVRITEFTVGEQGPASMPAQLPQNTGYTYAFEVNADEAVIAGAPEIEFNQPLVYYVENFLGFPAGTTVPLGSFDRATGTWSPEQSGIVLDVLAIVGGAAEVDVTGDGVADLGQALDDHFIDAAELQTLATLHGAGSSLWRVRLPHFTRPYDCNWPTTFPPDATPPPESPPEPAPEEPNPCAASGASVIECQNQIYHETVPVAGTEFALHYTSKRVPGYASARRLRIPIAGPIVPESLKGVEVDIHIAGRSERLELPAPEPNAIAVWDWDGLDEHGRKVLGRQSAKTTVRNVYGGAYKAGCCFGAPATGVSLGITSREDLEMSREWETIIGAPPHYSGLGGWNLSVHHHLSAVTNTVLLGDGNERDAKRRALTIKNIVGVHSGGSSDVVDGMDSRQASPSIGAIAVGPDGSVFAYSASRIYRISPERTISRYAGTAAGTPGNTGDGGPATSATLGLVDGMAVDSMGNLFFAQRQTGGCTVRKIEASTGIISRVAGKANVGCVPTADVEGQLATDVVLDQTRDVAIASDGSLYIAAKTVRRVDASGRITTIAGDGSVEGLFNAIPDGALAMPVPPDTLPLNAVAVEFDANGVLYILHENNLNGGPEDRIYRLGSDGRLERVAGCASSSCSNIANGLATDWRMDTFTNTPLALSPNGQLYIAGRSGSDYSMFTITRDGLLKPLFATQKSIYSEGQLAQLVRMPPKSIAFGPRC